MSNLFLFLVLTSMVLFFGCSMLAHMRVYINPQLRLSLPAAICKSFRVYYYVILFIILHFCLYSTQIAHTQLVLSMIKICILVHAYVNKWVSV